jgi:hypothetical protein
LWKWKCMKLVTLLCNISITSAVNTCLISSKVANCSRYILSYTFSYFHGEVSLQNYCLQLNVTLSTQQGKHAMFWNWKLILRSEKRRLFPFSLNLDIKKLAEGVISNILLPFSFSSCTSDEIISEGMANQSAIYLFVQIWARRAPNAHAYSPCSCLHTALCMQ